MMPWFQIELQALADQCDGLEDALLACGACAVTLRDAKNTPIYEPPSGLAPVWNDTCVQGLFSTQQHTIQQIKSQLQPCVSQDIWVTHEWAYIDDQPWEEVGRKGMSAMSFGEKLWVCPSWCRSPNPNAVNVILDPGCGFGTGMHPTTAMCLEWLAHYPVKNKTILDYGCGSGILAIASVLLGARFAMGVDIDLQACSASIKNAALNHVPAKQLSIVSPENVSMQSMDVVLANILLGSLVTLAPLLSACAKIGGVIVLSGILQEQWEILATAYRPYFVFSAPQVRERWVMVVGTRVA